MKHQSVEPIEDSDQLVAQLVRSAGPRVVPDAERFERARQTVHADWQSAIAHRKRMGWLRMAAVVAVLAISAGFFKTYWPASPVVVATADRVMGDVVVRHVRNGQLEVEPLRSGQLVSSGHELDTGATGRALLSWMNGAQLRVDRQSLVELKSGEELRLTRGAVYIETHSDGARDDAPLSVITPFGIVRHVGTRFEVRVAEGGARVRVRDGMVSFSNDNREPLTLNAGQQLSAVNGVVKVENGPGSADAEWTWLHEIAPSFAIEGRSLVDALDWLGQESGLRIIYTSNEARAQARDVILRGSIEGLDVHKSLIAVLAGSGLAFDLHADRVDIRPADPLERR